MGIVRWRTKGYFVFVGLFAGFCIISAMAHAPSLTIISFLFVMSNWYTGCWMLENDMRKYAEDMSAGLLNKEAE